MLLSKQFLIRNSTVPLLKVERSIWDRFLKQSEPSLNTFIGAEIATGLGGGGGGNSHILGYRDVPFFEGTFLAGKQIFGSIL